jgi:hypothetical protein
MKRAIWITLAAMVLWLGNTLPAYAMGGSRGRSGVQGHSGVHGHHETRGQHRVRNHPSVRERHEGFAPNHLHWHHGTAALVGWGFWWAPDWWGPISPYDVEPRVVIPPTPPVYIQQPPQYYWYYCTNPPGYYPYVQQCQSGWLTVIPPASAPPQ